jgi:hypothetical protein
MERETQVRTASILAILLGAWVALSPVFISITGAALVNVIAVGSVLAVLGIVQLFVKSSIPSWLSMLVAAWLFVSAYVFTVSTAVVWNETVSAIVAFLLGSWDGVEVTEARQHAVRPI